MAQQPPPNSNCGVGMLLGRFRPSPPERFQSFGAISIEGEKELKCFWRWNSPTLERFRSVRAF
eukprot:1010729-Rhodomonas_salina.1